MKSGLEGRNNEPLCNWINRISSVSMKSGLEGRNNSVSCLYFVNTLSSQ